MPDKTGFVHLHVHTEYSPLDGIGKLDDLCATAAADGSPAVAVTDHGTLGAVWKAAQAARNAGIKIIPGLEAYFAIGSRFEKNSMSIPRDDDTDTGDDEEGGGGRMKTKTYEHLTLLATSVVGWQNLAKMNSAASDSFWSKPRMDFELLAEHHEGVIALTGCIGGPIAGPLTRGDVDTARANLARLVAAMGHTSENQRVFAEVMDHGIPAEDRANSLIVDLAAEFDVELVATNDAHYVHATDAPSHDLWLAMGTVAQRDSGRFTEELWIDEPNRFHFHGEGYHLRTEAEMRALFDHRPGFERACDNTLVIADMVDENILPDALLRLPTYDVPEEYADAMSYLIHLVIEGAKTRWGDGPLRPDRADRLRREVATIRELRFPDYFLMVWDVLNAARAHGIYTGGGRGSAAGSAVSYCLRIVEVDPLEHGLLFERFLDESRTDPPDIDLDFDSEGQDWVFAYLAKRWGHEYVARLGSLGFSRARGSVKTAASVLLDSERRGVGAQLAKRIPIGSTIAQMLDETDQTGESFRTLMNSSPDYVSVVQRALEVEGMAANAGIHACGVIVSTERLAGMVPMRRERKKDWVGGWVIEWDKKDISEGDGKTGLQPLGLLKLDVLGLRNLDVVKRCVQQIKQTTGEIIDPYAVDYDPALPRVRALWDMLGQGRTAGIFQLESTGITELTEKVRPESLDELSAILALYRPGPMGMKMHEIYAARKRGFAPVDYGIFTNDPEEEKILSAVLGDTFGTIVFQEQIMQIGAAVAGFGGPMTNKLRSAVSKKDLAKIAAVGEQFIAEAQVEIVDESGAPVKMAFSKKTAENLWAAIKESGRYSFNRSHSVAYAWVSRLTAYFKASWPAQYGAAILAVTKDADRRLPVLSDLRAEALTILPPSVNQSFAASTGSAGSVRIGLSEIDGSGIELATAIVTEREANGRFISAADLMTRVRVPQGPGKPALQIASNQVGPLIESGALDEFGPRLGLMMVARALAAQPDTPIIDAEWSILERSARERKRLKGIVLSQHPLAALRDELTQYRAPNAQKPIGVRAIPDEDGTDVLALGVLASWSRSPGKFGERANFVLEGSGAQVPCVMWDKALKSLTGEPMVGSVVALRGRTKARIIEPPVSYEDTDDDDVDESAAVAEMAEPTVRTELTVYGLHLVPVPSAPRVQLSAPSIPPILWPVPALVSTPVTDPASVAAATVPIAPVTAASSQAPVRPAKVRAAASSAPAKAAEGERVRPAPADTSAVDPPGPPAVAEINAVDNQADATEGGATATVAAAPAAGAGAHLDIVLIQRGTRPARLGLGSLVAKYNGILTGENLAAVLSADAGSRTGLLPADAGPDRLVIAVLDQIKGRGAHQSLPLQVAGDDDAVTAHIYGMAKKNASPDLPFHPVKGQMTLFEVPGVAACPYGQDPLPRVKKQAALPTAASGSAAA